MQPIPSPETSPLPLGDDAFRRVVEWAPSAMVLIDGNGIILLVNLTIGQVHPPVGVLLFVSSSVAKVRFGEIVGRHDADIAHRHAFELLLRKTVKLCSRNVGAQNAAGRRIQQQQYRTILVEEVAEIRLTF